MTQFGFRVDAPHSLSSLLSLPPAHWTVDTLPSLPDRPTDRPTVKFAMSGDDKNNDFCLSFENEQTDGRTFMHHYYLLLPDSLWLQFKQFTVRCRRIGQTSHFAVPKVASFAQVTPLHCSIAVKASLPTMKSCCCSHSVHIANMQSEEGVVRRVRI